MDLTQVLINALSPAKETRDQALHHLQSAAEEHYAQFLHALVLELHAEDKPQESRQQAGLYLKLMITAQDEHILSEKLQRWHSCPPDVKAQIKGLLLQVLASPVKSARHTAALAIAAFAAQDIPLNEWPDLMDKLVNAVTNAETSEGTKVAVLETLGYTCDSLSSSNVEPEVVNRILTAVVDGLGPDKPTSVQTAAIIALKNCLIFADQNFEKEDERNMIMQVLCTATRSEVSKIREKAYQCLSTIVESYYEKLPAYMLVLFQLTTEAIQSDEHNVAMSAIEFWSTICEEEIEVKELVNESDDVVFLRIAEQAAEAVTPILLGTLLKQDEDADDEVWNIASSGATCLGLFAQAVEDNIVPLIFSFVQSNITSDEWRAKEAGIMAFACALEGPSKESLGALISGCLPILVSSLSDNSELVKDSAAWALARICDLHVECITDEAVPPLITGLANALDDSARVAAQACFALYNLAEEVDSPDDAATNSLSAYMAPLIEKLFFVTNRADADEHNLCSSAYEAINMLVEHSAQDMTPLVQQVLTEALNRLEASLSHATAEDSLYVQSLLCGLCHVCVKKLGAGILPISDRIMMLLCQVFQSSGATAHEDAFLAIGQVADQLGEHFKTYLPYFMPILLQGLMQVEHHHVCQAAVGVVGDVCRSSEKLIMPYCDDIVKALLELLQSQQLNRRVKPAVLAVFADVAMALNGDFARYASVVLTMLQQASMATLQGQDEDAIEYMNVLRESILEAYTGILSGLREDNRHSLIEPFLDSMFMFAQTVAEDEHRDKTVTKALLGLVGDIGLAFGRSSVNFMRQPFVQALVQEGSSDEDLISQAQWAHQMMLAASH